MDRVIESFPILDEDEDLIYTEICAYQKRPKEYEYGQEYFDMYASYEGNQASERILSAKNTTINRWYTGEVLDVGIGSGEFIKSRPGTYGCDINPAGIEWLEERGLYDDHIESFGGVCFWDVLEHARDPSLYLKRISQGAFLFCSLPVYTDLCDVKTSKHYKPDEHLYYFLRDQFGRWAEFYDFELLEYNDLLAEAGREGIGTYVLRKL